MPNISKEGKKLIQLWVSDAKWEELRQASDSIEEPITAWCRRAIYGALRNWSAPAMKKANWPKCSVCLKHHNEQEHYE